MTVTTATPTRFESPPQRWRGVARILGFLGALGLAAIVLHTLVTSGLRRIPTSTWGVWNQVIAGHCDADIVITGSSRALVHYDPEILARATGLAGFNLGQNGARIDLQVAALKTYLAHNRAPRLVIHNLDMQSLTVTREIYEPVQYVPYLGERELYAPLRRIKPDVWKWRYLPLYGYAVEDMRFTWITGLAALLGHYPPQDQVRGFSARDLEWSDEFDRFRAANPTGVVISTEFAGEVALEALIHTCRSRGIGVILVYSPEFRAMQHMTKNRGEIIERFRAIAARDSVPFCDYSVSPLCDDRSLFYNSQHLNRRGATAFSTDLGRRVAEWLVYRSGDSFAVRGTAAR